MHVYTPPHYDEKSRDYPVLYLLHGGGDEDSGWSTIGRAGFILDNLLAADSAVPMLIVMPNGSLPAMPIERIDASEPPLEEALAAARAAAMSRFSNELMNDVLPFVEQRFRARANPESRALAGLSMGGLQTMEVLSGHADQFAYVAIWSAGLFSQEPQDFEDRHRRFLRQNDAVNERLKLLSVSVGKDDFAYPGSQALAEIFTRHDIDHEFNMTGGGHTWLNWRRYLHEFAPQLFR